MQTKINSYLNSIKDKNQTFRFSKHSNSTLLSNAFAVSTAFLNDVDLNTYRTALVNFFKDSQDQSGNFIDANYDYFPNPQHGPDYVVPQFTFFSLIALDILGEKNTDFSISNNYTDEGFKVFLENSLRKNFWATSNQVMFILYFLTYELTYNPNADEYRVMKLLRMAFDFFNSNQNESDGLWGAVPYTKSQFHMAYGAAHIYLFYDFFNEEIPNPDKIIDSVLKQHKWNGLIETDEGGACEDYDIIEIYLRCLKQTDHRRDEILEKLSLMKSTIKKSQNFDGGFPYRIKKGGIIKKLFSNAENVKYKYSSWNYMETPIYKSDIWATFFRSLSLKAIDYIFDKSITVNSYSLPGWGFLKK